MQPQMLVMNMNTQRETGRKAQLSNIEAARSVADIIRTTLGPRSMLKMILSPTGQITLTNDGNAILREVAVSHPAAKSIIELSRTQDDEVGDGTTSVIIVAAEILNQCKPFLEKGVHPTKIVAALRVALDECLDHLDYLRVPIDVEKDTHWLYDIAKASVGTKLIQTFQERLCMIGVHALQMIRDVNENGKVSINVKSNIKVEKIPGGELNQSCVLKGVIINKDVTHQKMRRFIEKPRVVVLDCPLEYKKGESQTNIELSRESDFETLLRMEEEYIKEICQHILRVKPDLVLTEKGVSDLAQHYLVQGGCTVLRRVKKSIANRVCLAVGATTVNRPQELQESHVGTKCGKFHVEKIGDEYFSFIDDCEDPKACSIILRGGSKDILNEVSRNLDDILSVCRCVMLDAGICGGGGAVEMALAKHLRDVSRTRQGLDAQIIQSVAASLEVIPRTIIENCGSQVIKVITELRAKHNQDKNTIGLEKKEGEDNKAKVDTTTSEYYGVDGVTGEVCNMFERGVIDCVVVKKQILKTAIECATMLLRVDEIVSGLGGK